MNRQRKKPSAAFWCGAAAFAALLAYRIDLVGWFIEGLIAIFGDWAWVLFLVLWICTMVAIAVVIVRRSRNGAK